MGKYLPGDVLLAPVALDDCTLPKARPVVVIRADVSGRIHVLPVSSRPPSDAPGLPLSIDDFSTGGLDLFSESYVMTSRVVAIPGSMVIGRKGRLSDGSLAEIAGRVPEGFLPGPDPGPKKKPGRQRR